MALDVGRLCRRRGGTLAAWLVLPVTMTLRLREGPLPAQPRAPATGPAVTYGDRDITKLIAGMKHVQDFSLNSGLPL